MSPGPDTEMLAERLRNGGVLDAFLAMGIDPGAVIEALVATRHHYERYRWSVALGDGFRAVVHAVPPEEELGWTPWERWVVNEAGRASRECWIAAPPNGGRRMGWQCLSDERTAGLEPLFTGDNEALRTRFDLIGVSDALTVLGIDRDEFLTSMEPGRAGYSLCRWVVIPHFLADDGPVVYSIPSSRSADGWPWETWYSADGQIVHHVHLDQPRPGCTEEWSEPVGAPQRPPEVLGRTWFWGDPGSMVPAEVPGGPGGPDGVVSGRGSGRPSMQG